MHTMVVLAVVISAAPVAERPPRIASPGFSAVNLDSSLTSFYAEHVAQQLKLAGLEVATAKEIQSLLGLERQKALLGCSSDSGSCFAELANALGADGVLLGDLAKIGSRYQVNLKIINAATGKTLALFAESTTSEEAVIDLLTRAAHTMALDVSRALGKPLSISGSAGSSVRPWALLPLGVGVLAVGAGAVCLGVSLDAHATLISGSPGQNGAQLRDTGKLTGDLAVVGFAVGGAALVGAAILYFAGAPPPPIAVSVSPGGASVMLRGEFP